MTLKCRESCFLPLHPPHTPYHASMILLTRLMITEGISHKIYFMGPTKKSKHNKTRKNIFSSSSSLTQNRIRIHLGKILFISRSRDLHFEHANIWWINITNNICHLILLQVQLSSRTLLISSCIWHWFGRKTYRIIFFFN